jgi:transcriptional regulator with XRE-family HTH domain
MKHIGNELDIILSKNRKLKKKDFAEKIGMTDVNLSKIFKKSSIDAELLEKISKILNVPISFWFDEMPSDFQVSQKGNGNVIGNKNQVTISDCENKLEVAYKEIEHLKLRLKDKEEIIEILKKK